MKHDDNVALGNSFGSRLQFSNRIVVFLVVIYSLYSMEFDNGRNGSLIDCVSPDSYTVPEFIGKTLDFRRVSTAKNVHVSDASRKCAENAVVTIRVCSLRKTKEQFVIIILPTEFCNI